MSLNDLQVFLPCEVLDRLSAYRLKGREQLDNVFPLARRPDPISSNRNVLIIALVLETFMVNCHNN